MARTHKSAAATARDARKRKSLDGWRREGTGRGAARAAGVGETTVRRWHRDDPAYRAEAAAAIDEFALVTGQECHRSILEHVRAAMRGDMVLTRRGTEGVVSFWAKAITAG